MARKNRPRKAAPPASRPPARPAAPRSGAAGVSSGGLIKRPGLTIGAFVVIAILLAIVVLGADVFFGALFGTSGSVSSPTAPAAATPTSTQPQTAVVHNVNAAQLHDMLAHKDFVLVNVKTPYIGEIDGTDLYVPYDQLASRASELPADKGAKILVYCRSGVQSGQAAQTLIGLGYTNVWNLDGGMNAWQAAGFGLVQKNRG